MNTIRLSALITLVLVSTTVLAEGNQSQGAGAGKVTFQDSAARKDATPATSPDVGTPQPVKQSSNNGGPTASQVKSAPKAQAIPKKK